MVVKKDGRREEYSRDKLRGGLLRACEKTTIGVDQIDRILEIIESRINETSNKEIQARQVGEFLMDELRKLDKVAYVRFASVYREFSDVSQFIEMLQGLSPKQLAGKAKARKAAKPKKK